MNYRHAFHAGNFGDVLKHVVLVALLERLAQKDKPFFFLDTHAGRGRYDLDGEAARKSGEANAGIHRCFIARLVMNALLTGGVQCAQLSRDTRLSTVPAETGARR